MNLIDNINLAESKGTLRGYSNPQKKSFQDGTDFKYKDKRLSLWKARYSYSPKKTSKNSRDFCTKMVGIAKSGVLYRKEDIVKMGQDGVNSELAASGKNSYSIWFYKGGALCHHFWRRHIYVRKWNAINIPSWVNFLVDIPIPKMTNQYAQAVTFLIISTTGLPLAQRKNMFANVIDYKAFVERSARGYFQRYLMGLNLPNSVKNILFARFGKSTTTLISFFKGLLKGKPTPMRSVMSKLPITPLALDFQQSGVLFDNLHGVLKGVTRGNDRKIGIPKSRSKTKNLENSEEIDVREARRRAIKYPANDIRVGTKPIDMPNRGYMRRRGAWQADAVKRAASNYIKKETRRIKRDVKRKMGL